MRLPAAATAGSGPRFRQLATHGQWCHPGRYLASVAVLLYQRRGAPGGGLARRVATGLCCPRLCPRRATAALPQHRSSPGSPPGFSTWPWYLCRRPGALSGGSHVVSGRWRLPVGSKTPLPDQGETARGVFQPSWPTSKGTGVTGTPRKQGAKGHHEDDQRSSSFLGPCCCPSTAAVVLGDAAWQ